MSGRQEQILSVVEQLGFVRVDDLAVTVVPDE
jgi:DeoR/GlpR family transcriptional regulator of sugar metabolism